MTVVESPFIIEGYIPRGVITVISGEGESGKSLLTEHMAIAVSNGLPWFGHATEQGPVIILDKENNAAHDLKPRFTKFQNGFNVDGKMISTKDVLIPEIPSDIYLDSEKGMIVISTLVEIYRPSLIIIDSLGDFVRGDQNSSTVMFGALNGLNDILSKYGCAAIILHHMRKWGESNNGAGQRLRGSGAIRDAVRSHLSVSKTGSSIRLEHEKSNRGKAEDPMHLEFLATDDTFGFAIVEKTTKRRGDERRQQIISILDFDGKKRKDVCAEAKKQFGINESAATKIWTELVADGTGLDDKYGIWKLTPPKVETA